MAVNRRRPTHPPRGGVEGAGDGARELQTVTLTVSGGVCGKGAGALAVQPMHTKPRVPNPNPANRLSNSHPHFCSNKQAQHPAPETGDQLDSRHLGLLHRAQSLG